MVVIGLGEIIFVILIKLSVSLGMVEYPGKVILRDFSLLYFDFEIVGALLRPPLSQQLRNVCNLKTRQYFITVITLLITKDLLH